VGAVVWGAIMCDKMHCVQRRRDKQTTLAAA
jgi:hypothetical protein